MPSSLLLSTTYSCTPTSTFTKTPLPFITQPSFKTRTKQAHGFRVSCNASPAQDNNENNQLILPDNIDRRNLLLGLGGLYTAAKIASLPSALASPITAPDIASICKDANQGFESEGAVRTGKCCPPSLGKMIQPFVFPRGEKTRMRWPAHKGSKKQVTSYKKAMQAIRGLPDDHPHSFVSQAKIHCAYCNGGYTQVASGFPEISIQIHNSWLFFPFHRWYLYFYERILRKYSEDDEFALPYWNWDTPEGMTIPQMFVKATDDDPLFGNKNPLYDEYRNLLHYPPEVVNLFFNGGSVNELDSERQIACNLSMMYRDLKSNATGWESFFGGKYTAGAETTDNEPSAGSVEGNSHTAVHIWVGRLKSDPSSPNGEDMGNFYSAGYDPLFYAHHANVDRTWKLWKDSGIPGHSEPTENDWLNASYVFYDENENLVRVSNKDSVNIKDLKYEYDYSETPWKNSRPARRMAKSKDLSSALIGVEVKTVEEAFKTPASVEPLLKVRVKRPAKNRSPEEKAKANEILCINGIQFNSNKFVKFDVFVNDKVDKNTEKSKLPTPCDPEFAGSFAQVPHSDSQKGGMLMPSAARFGLNELLEDTMTEDEEYVLVALVARAGCEDLTVSGIEIKLVPTGSA